MPVIILAFISLFRTAGFIIIVLCSVLSSAEAFLEDRGNWDPVFLNTKQRKA